MASISTLSSGRFPENGVRTMSSPVHALVNDLLKGAFLQFVLNPKQMCLPLTRSHAHTFTFIAP